MKKKILKIILGFFVVTIGYTFLLKYVPIYLTPLMVRRYIEAKIEHRDITFEKHWVPFEQISPNLVRAAIASEDDTFLEHNGFVWENIKQAYESNQKGNRRRGGSSISQQTAKNVFTFCSSTYTRKAFEAYFTFLIETIWGKQRIIEVYLNIAELGDGVFGVDAAAKHFYHKSAAKVTRSEAALMVTALPSPRRMDIAHPGPYMRKRQAHTLWMMNNLPFPLEFDK